MQVEPFLEVKGGWGGEERRRTIMIDRGRRRGEGGRCTAQDQYWSGMVWTRTRHAFLYGYGGEYYNITFTIRGFLGCTKGMSSLLGGIWIVDQVCHDSTMILYSAQATIN